MKLKIISLLIIKNRRSLKTITAILIMTLFLTAPLTTIQKTPIKAQQTIQTLTNPITNEIINDSVLDIEYIYNITKALSNIIFTEYNESAGEIAKGRFYGTKGEHRAAEILMENMTELGLYTTMEQIGNTPGHPKLLHKLEVLEYNLKINGKSIDCHPSPSWYNVQECIDYNYSYKGLKVKRIPKFHLIPRIDLLKEPFVFICEDELFNPDVKTLHTPIYHTFFNPLHLNHRAHIKTRIQPRIFRMLYKNCKGVLIYDFNEDTYDQVILKNNVLPIFFINGSDGNKIINNIEECKVDFYLNQHLNKSVISYNVIGQLNGTDPSKTVLIDCLYDSWWCQGTADSAIGMAMVLGIAKYFKDHNITPKYNIKFIGFGGEEYGFAAGSKYYEYVHRRDENIIYVIDLNQLGFKQEEPRLTLNIVVNKLLFLKEIWNIVKKTDYVKRTNNTADIKHVWAPRGAPSDDQAFVRNRPLCKTVCFLKDSAWILHHRTGINHTEGDVLKYFDPVDVSVTGEIVLNVTKHLIVESYDSSTDNVDIS